MHSSIPLLSLCWCSKISQLFATAEEARGQQVVEILRLLSSSTEADDPERRLRLRQRENPDEGFLVTGDPILRVFEVSFALTAFIFSLFVAPHLVLGTFGESLSEQGWLGVVRGTIIYFVADMLEAFLSISIVDRRGDRGTGN